MIFTKNETLEDILVQVLTEEVSVADIQNHPKIRKRNVSIQAIYKALKKLTTDGTVIKHRKYFVTSKEWLNQVQQFATSTNIFVPEEGSKVQFTFTSFSQVDAYWKHVVYTLPKEDLLAPFFSYLPHNFWIHNPERVKSEAEFYAGFEKQKQDGFLVIGASDEEDMKTKSKLQNKFLRISTLNYNKFKRSEHIAIMGKYVTTTKLSIPTSKEIDSIYKKYSEEELITKLKSTFNKKTTIKITLECSKSKAESLRKYIGKDFYIPKKQ